ncbi:hypothetical protein TBR22_A02580 [Luteitalea sp. TBR-22]|uniref:hypothetical protein n=1 Tax=Luteitalea sp. TBR-22 TaxID=2802971 RepID=UPI001AF904B7|nr:hypothetical protein [Luteitalea sp. TBR-22]BCS31058.1 hypothetical protein TBR22_A02580 [Luteitalea sp. TBR-22]
MSRFVRVVAVAALVVLSSLASFAQAPAPGPMVGTWVMNPAKSTPMTINWKERRMEVTREADGLTFSSVTVAMDGTSSKWGFTTKGDGKPVPVTGAQPAPDTVEAMIEPALGDSLGGASGLFTYKVGDVVVLQSIIELAADRKSLTVKSVRTMPDGSKAASQTHYDKR